MNIKNWRLRIRKQRRRGSSKAEAAISLPVIILVTFAMVNISMAWYAAVAASNAANYGARVGSVAQTNPTEQATAAAQTRLDSINIGTYAINATGDDTDGSKITVSVDWTVPNYITGLMTLLGSSNRNSFAGTVISTFPQDGL